VPSQCGIWWDIVHGCEYRPGHAGKHRCWCRSTPRREQPGYGVQMSARARWQLTRRARRRDARRDAALRKFGQIRLGFVTDVLDVPLSSWQKAVIAHA
jgi:hypothetical protein